MKMTMEAGITIKRADEADYKVIVLIGRTAVEDAHRASCSASTMNTFLANNYNDEAIKLELGNTANIYHIIYYNGKAAGFSKIVLHATHANIKSAAVTKLDRLYLLNEYHGMKLGAQLLQFNIRFSAEKYETGMWLFTWTGNSHAVNFYLKAGFQIIAAHSFRITDDHYNPNHQMWLQY